MAFRIFDWVVSKLFKKTYEEIKGLRDELEAKEKRLKEADSRIIEQQRWITSLDNDIRKEREKWDAVGGVIPSFLLSDIIRHLPDANLFANGNITKEMLNGGSEYKGIRVPFRFCRIVGDFKGIEIEVKHLSQRFIIPLYKFHSNYNIGGIAAELDTYLWDFRHLQILSMTEHTYDMVIGIVKGQSEASELLIQ